MSDFNTQFQNHGLHVRDGDLYTCDVRSAVENVVSKVSSIFVVDKVLKRFLEHGWIFEDVTWLRIAPTSTLHQHPYSNCGRHDVKSRGGCAQQKCHEIRSFLQPVLVPYLDLSTFDYNPNSSVNVPEKMSDGVAKYGVRKLEEPLYQTFQKLTLNSHGVANSQCSVEGSVGADGGLGWATSYGRDFE